jgi:hypothetical protein
MARSAIPVRETGGMNRRNVLLAGVVVAMTMALGACGSAGERSYRFRMTVEADTPQGPRTGSSVMEVVAERQDKFVPEARPLVSGLKGEAVTVDTPSGPIFVLLKLPHGDKTYLQAVTFALAPDLRQGGWEPFWKAMGRLGGWFGSAKGELPREDWPVMVRFRDLNDPKTVEKVDPDVVSVKRILLETTSDRVTTGVEKKLPWFERLAASGARLDGDNSIAVLANPATAAGNFAPGDFSTIYRIQTGSSGDSIFNCVHRLAPRLSAGCRVGPRDARHRE